MAADGARIAGRAHDTEPPAGEHVLAAADERPAAEVGVPVVAVLAGVVDDHVPAVEDAVVGAGDAPAAARGAQGAAAGRHHVEALVRPSPRPRLAERADAAAV